MRSTECPSGLNIELLTSPGNICGWKLFYMASWCGSVALSVPKHINSNYLTFRPIVYVQLWGCFHLL